MKPPRFEATQDEIAKLEGLGDPRSVAHRGELTKSLARRSVYDRDGAWFYCKPDGEEVGPYPRAQLASGAAAAFYDALTVTPG